MSVLKFSLGGWGEGDLEDENKDDDLEQCTQLPSPSEKAPGSCLSEGTQGVFPAPHTGSFALSA